jgi:hypothetical protein
MNVGSADGRNVGTAVDDEACVVLMQSTERMHSSRGSEAKFVIVLDSIKRCSFSGSGLSAVSCD